MKPTTILILIGLLTATILQAHGTTIYEEDFETGQLDPAHWMARPSLAGVAGLVDVADGIGLGSSLGARLGKSSDGNGFTTNALDLKLDLAGWHDVKLSFWIFDNQDETHSEDGIYFSDDNGMNFEKVLDFHPADWCDYRYGQFTPVDVSQLATQHELDLNDQFVIRFQQHDDGEERDPGGGPSDDP